jgi:hypothetical protein
LNNGIALNNLERETTKIALSPDLARSAGRLASSVHTLARLFSARNLIAKLGKTGPVVIVTPAKQRASAISHDHFYDQHPQPLQGGPRNGSINKGSIERRTASLRGEMAQIRLEWASSINKN